MSQDRRGADHRRLIDAQVGRVRDGGGRPFVTVGYAPGGAALASRPFSGDQKFAFVKDPPDVEGPYRLGPIVQIFAGAVISGNIPGPPFATGNPWLDLLVLPPRTDTADTTSAGDGTGIDVRGIANIVLFIEYFPIDPAPSPVGAELIILPEAYLERPTDGDTIVGGPAGRDWFPFGIVSDALITPGTFLQNYAAQQTFARELRFAGGGWDASVSGPLTETLSLPVADYDEVRFLVGDRAATTSGLNLFYALER